MRQELRAAYSKINSLETHDRKSNLVITGRVTSSYAEASSQQTGDDEPISAAENHTQTEIAVIELCHTKLDIKLLSSDISITHRLQRKKNSKGPPSIIVCFTTMKARDSVYRARKELKGLRSPIYINEDITKATADHFRRARGLWKKKEIAAMWTIGGILHVKATDHPFVNYSEADLLTI